MFQRCLFLSSHKWTNRFRWYWLTLWNSRFIVSASTNSQNWKDDAISPKVTSELDSQHAAHLDVNKFFHIVSHKVNCSMFDLNCWQISADYVENLMTWKKLTAKRSERHGNEFETQKKKTRVVNVCASVVLLLLVFLRRKHQLCARRTASMMSRF